MERVPNIKNSDKLSLDELLKTEKAMMNMRLTLQSSEAVKAHLEFIRLESELEPKRGETVKLGVM